MKEVKVSVIDPENGLFVGFEFFEFVDRLTHEGSYSAETIPAT
jgi:hypothetical protein